MLKFHTLKTAVACAGKCRTLYYLSAVAWLVPATGHQQAPTQCPSGLAPEQPQALMRQQKQGLRPRRLL